MEVSNAGGRKMSETVVLRLLLTRKDHAMTSPKKIRTVCAVCAFGLAVLSAGSVPSRGQTPKGSSVPTGVNEQVAYRQSIQRALNLANQEKKYVEAIQKATEAQSSAQKAFGPLSEQVDEALHVLCSALRA